MTFRTATATFLVVTGLAVGLYRKLRNDNLDPKPETPHAVVLVFVQRSGRWIATVRERQTYRVVHETRDYTSLEEASGVANRWVRERAGRFELKWERKGKKGDGEDEELA
jgi:hypothetical protein